ncbi:MAG: type I-A CRISPR-associated protein Cas8a2/Csa4 [Archaeoglobaceae archaeon]
MLETPGVDEIFDLYVAYGMAECLVRGGVEDFELIPLGNKYKIVAKEENRGEIENALKNGLIDALEEMLALHQALMDSSGSSEADFSRGANINTMYFSGIPKILAEVKEDLINNRIPIGNETIPITLMPSAGKFLPQHFSVKGGNPIKIDRKNYSLAWVGFHFYTPYIKYTKEDKTTVHVYALIPLESLNALEILALKDLKKKLPHYWAEDFMSNSKLALLYHLAHTETLGALEVLTKKSFSLKAYTLNREGNNQAVRYFDTQNIGKLMNFLWMLKRKSVYHAIKFIDDLLRVDSEAGLSFVDAVLFDEVDGFYKALRIAKRSGVNVPRKVVEGIQEYINVLG